MEWIPVNNDTTAKTALISWDGMREINLGSTLLPANRVLTGLKFDKIGDNRLILSSYSHEFDFATGKLEQKNFESFGDQHLPVIAT